MPPPTRAAVPPADVLALFRCPRCAGPLAAEGDRLVCRAGHALDASRGYVDARLHDADVDATTAATFASFGYEWTTFSALSPEDEHFWREYMADVPLARIKDEVALDAGCGMGRYSRVTAGHVRHLVALDGSDAVDAAAHNLAACDSATVVRADLREAPFAEGSFGLVTCLGVLHHLAEPDAAFQRLARLLRAGGVLVLYLYSRPAGGGIRSLALRAASTLRRVSVRLPHPLLRLLCVPLTVALYLGVVVPGRIGETRGWGSLAALPLAPYRGHPPRVLWLDTFDRLSAPVEHRFVWTEVEPWFAEAGLRVLAVREYGGLVIVAERPS